LLGENCAARENSQGAGVSGFDSRVTGRGGEELENLLCSIAWIHGLEFAAFILGKDAVSAATDAGGAAGACLGQLDVTATKEWP
jgi:hypothetical protein